MLFEVPVVSVVVNAFASRVKDPRFETGRKSKLRESQATVLLVPVPSPDKWDACVRGGHVT